VSFCNARQPRISLATHHHSVAQSHSGGKRRAMPDFAAAYIASMA